MEASGNPRGGGESKKTWRLSYRYFRGTLATWDDLFNQAAQFATEAGPEHVIGVSHSADGGDGVVTVWYWTQTEETENEPDR